MTLTLKVILNSIFVLHLTAMNIFMNFPKQFWPFCEIVTEKQMQVIYKHFAGILVCLQSHKDKIFNHVLKMISNSKFILTQGINDSHLLVWDKTILRFSLTVLAFVDLNNAN